jgi:hypothetical protein
LRAFEVWLSPETAKYETTETSAANTAAPPITCFLYLRGKDFINMFDFTLINGKLWF